MPSSRSVAWVQAVNNQTNGRTAEDSRSIGRATSTATRSGYIWPSRLGTSSPKMMVKKVMITTTRAVAVTSTARWLSMGSSLISQVASGCENAASPTMPLSTPMDVMPICTVDSHLVGSSCSTCAANAPGSPASAITASRALRDAVSAISDIANKALTRIRKTSRATSMQRHRSWCPVVRWRPA